MDALNQSISTIATAVNMTPPQLVKYCHDLTATPSLIILFIVLELIFLCVGMSLTEKKKKLLTIWILSFILGGIALLILIFLPNVTQQLVEAVK